jgi:hypothetical protein
MMRVNWSVVETAAQLLEGDERDAVLGDLSETGEGVWRGLVDVTCLIVRRQAGVWKSWRPWLAAFELALPGSLLMMGSSLSVSWKFQHLMIPMWHGRGAWLFNSALLWPTWYMAATARRSYEVTR